MKLIIQFLFLIFSLSLHAQVAGTEQLQEMLDLDRFETYASAWSETMKGRGKVEIAEAVRKLSPKDLLSLGLDKSKFKDAMNYDGLILEILNKKRPELKVKPQDVEWGYSFYKRKLNDAYLVTAVNASAKASSEGIISKPLGGRTPTPLEVIPADASEVLLDVDAYASDRTTRGVFWEASASQRRVELYVGSAGDFQEDIKLRGSRIIGKVATKARNYNPIYLVQDAGDSKYHYAITEISGADRLKHFQMQSALIRWQNANGVLAPPPPVAVVGDAAAKLASEEKHLTQVLRNIPKADKVVIGQKGAFEKTFSSIGKMNSLLKMSDKNKAQIELVLSADEMKLLQKAADNSENMTEFAMKNGSAIEKAYTKATSLLTKNDLLMKPFAVFSLDRGSYEVSDYVIDGKDGKTQRWRIFSNVWGDEVLPIAGALKATNHLEVNYIGTAGALPDSNLKVGDLVIPTSATDSTGKVYELKPDARFEPVGAKKVDSVMNVKTPFEETQSWLNLAKKSSQVVEVETGYLASVFNGKDDRLNVMLLISDMVGSEDETLATASSSVRRKAQISSMSEIINTAKAKAPGSLTSGAPGLSSWLKEMAPTRDPVSALQVLREAELKGINTKDELQSFMKTQKSFTTAKLEAALNGADDRLVRLMMETQNIGALPQLSVLDNFLDGRFNPATGAVNIHLTASTPEVEKELNRLMLKLKATDPEFEKFLKVSISNSTPSAQWITIPGVLSDTTPTLSSLYEEGLLKFGGLASTENRNGALKFVKVADPSLNGPLTTTAFFPPNEKTQALIETIKGVGDGPEKRLENIIKLKNSDGARMNYSVRMTKVESLSGGSLAQIVPVLDDAESKLIIEIKITDKGLKSPVVVFEEMVHLEQIVGQSFRHPYEWAETVANAKAGSLRSIEKLARMEVEAATVGLTHMGNQAAMFEDGTNTSNVQDYAKERLAHAQSRYTPVAKEARAEARKAQAAWKALRPVFDGLEKQGAKFNDLVMNNDRAGVRKMLETYLPWDLMEPSEKNAWKTWLEAIEHPDLENRKVVFRGMDDYGVLQKAKSSDVGILSTVLMKNQGNYTRRLRSLTTLRDRFSVMYASKTPMPDVKNNPSLLVAMINHANDPLGSPFLSVSDNRVAGNFGKKERVALLVDEKRLVPNAMAFAYGTELERLIPVVVFPDEVIYYHGKNSGWVDSNRFIQKVEENLGRPLKPDEIVSTMKPKEFFQMGYERIKPLLLDATQLPTLSGQACKPGSSCNCVYETLDALLK